MSRQLQLSPTPTTTIKGRSTMSGKPTHFVIPTDVTGEVKLVYPFSKEEYKKNE